jgi:hypothetical protein
MKKLVKTLEGLPWIIRVILTIVWGVYGNLLRLFRSLAAKNTVGVILAVLLLICGGFAILWIIDIIMVIFGKRVWWID